MYYFWEDYARQERVPKRILSRLAEIGYSFRDQVSAFTPMDDYRNLIREEMREKFQDLWGKLQGRTPGIFLTEKPLHDFDPEKDTWLFFPITQTILRSDAAATQFFRDIHAECSEAIKRKAENTRDASVSMLPKLYESIQLKPSFMGIGVDLKPILSSLSRRNR